MRVTRNPHQILVTVYRNVQRIVEFMKNVLSLIPVNAIMDMQKLIREYVTLFVISASVKRMRNVQVLIPVSVSLVIVMQLDPVCQTVTENVIKMKNVSNRGNANARRVTPERACVCQFVLQNVKITAIVRDLAIVIARMVTLAKAITVAQNVPSSVGTTATVSCQTNVNV